MQISVHKIDGSRIEIRTIHEIAPPTRKRGFELSAYFFVPATLAYGNSDELDGPQALVQSVIFPKLRRKNHYEIFTMNLASILDAHNALSPLTRLEQMAQQVALPAGRVLYELQMLLCVAKNACTNTRRTQIQRIRTRSSGEKKLIHQELLHEVESEFYQITRSYLQIQNRLEQLGERYSHEVLRNIDEAYRWTLEDLNHQILAWILRATRLGEYHQFSQKFQDFHQNELKLQWLYQRQHGFATLNDDEYNNESYLFHQRELKAWRCRGLSMLSAEARSPNVMTQIWLSIASAVAMIFALAVTLLSMAYYRQWSGPFLVFAVLGYTFKDRIKEILRNLFSRNFGNYQLLKLYDPRSKIQCGSIRETLEVCENLGPDIITLRNLRKNPLSRTYNREIVIAYRERLNLNSQTLFKTHKRLQNGCQMLEFNLQPYLQNIKESEAKLLWQPILTKPADKDSCIGNEEEAAKAIPLLEPESLPSSSPVKNDKTPSYKKLKIKQSYHLTLVTRATTFDGQEVIERHRIVLREGRITWIERIM